MTELTFHPVADLFPMLADDELADLAADIKQRGLIQPIVLDADGRVLDGRNRLAACRLVDIEPAFTTYEGDDPDGYALAVNGQRREMTKAQKAIVAANFSKLEKFGDQRKAARALGISDSRVSEAKVIVEHKDLAELVLAGTRPFSAALEEARERGLRAAEEKAAKDRLRASAPDLAALIDDERMSLDDAIAALDAREEKARQEAEAARREAEARASEEERQRRIREQERQESLERDRERLRMVITGWSTMRDLILPDPDGPRAAEIVAGLGESDRLALKRIVADVTE